MIEIFSYVPFAYIVKAIILGKKWNTEDAAIKAQYKAIAEKLKKKHLQDHPGYQYQPRKPSEKKRRMTHRKAASLFRNAGLSPVSTTNMANDASAVVPNFETTPAGNVTVTLGDNNLDEETFEAMLEIFNASVVQDPNLAGALGQVDSIHSEHTEESQDECNLFAEFLDINMFK